MSSVDDMNKALEFAKTQDGFEQKGSFGHPRSCRPPSSVAKKTQAKIEESDNEQAKKTQAKTEESDNEQAKPEEPRKEPVKEPAKNPEGPKRSAIPPPPARKDDGMTWQERHAAAARRGVEMAHASAMQTLRRIEFREQSIKLSPNPPGFETDVDHMFVRPPPNDNAVSPHLMARRAALQYAQRLQYAGRIVCQDSIPRSMRSEVAAGAFTSSRGDEEEFFGF